MVKQGHFLDGRVFLGYLKSRAGVQIPEQVSFRDNKFRSRFLLQHGYPEVPYALLKEKAASEAEHSRFTLQITHPITQKVLTIHASQEGDDLDLKIDVEKDHQSISHLEFTGTSFQMRPDSMPLGV